MSWKNYKSQMETRGKQIRDAVARSKEILKRDELTEDQKSEVESLQALVAKLQAENELLKSQEESERALEEGEEGETEETETDEEVASERSDSKSRSLRTAIFAAHTSKKGSPKTYRDQAFGRLIRGYQLTDRERSALQEQRALTAAGEDAGAEMVPQGFFNGYYEKLREFSVFRRLNPSVHIVTNTRPTPYPIYNDLSNSGEIIGENSTPTGAATPSTDQLLLGGKVFSSKTFSLGRQFIRNAGHNAEAAVEKQAAVRIGRRQDEYFTDAVLADVSIPEGLGDYDGTSYTGIEPHLDVFIDTTDALSAPYQAGAVMALNRNTLNVAKKLKDSHGDNIWFNGSAGNAGNPMPPSIAGVPYVENWALPDGVIVYGNFQQGFVIQELGSAELHVDPYTNGSKYMIDYTLFHEADGGVVDDSAFVAAVIDLDSDGSGA